MNRKLILLGLIGLLSFSFCQARENLLEQFKNKEAIIYAINIRNFGAIDKDNDGIIGENDAKGTFLNAKDRLKDLAQEGINTIYLLPITKTGKIKALGTAGSLYAMDSFSEIAPELDDVKNPMSVADEAKVFVKTAHSLNMNVIVDLPCCGSYDLCLSKPDLFVQDEDNNPVVPADWTDVRLFKTVDEDNNLDKEIIKNFKNFVDMVQGLEIDGIRADVAAIKPPEFWAEIIKYAKAKNPNFVFLAEASPDWDNPAKNYIKHYSTIDELLDSGFDSYYGSFSDFKNIKTKQEFDEKIEKNLKILKNHKDKSMISALATHDQQAPILRGKNYWNMVLWLSTTLPVNTYFLDGFSTGDSFSYPFENKKAAKTYTDDDFYYVHSGMFDIFNFSRAPMGNFVYLKKQYIKAIKFKTSNIDLFKYGTYKPVKTENDKVFGYTMTYQNKELLVVGSLDDKENQKATIKLASLKKDHLFSVINSLTSTKSTKGFLNLTFEPLELKVFLITSTIPQED